MAAHVVGDEAFPSKQRKSNLAQVNEGVTKSQVNAFKKSGKVKLTPKLLKAIEKLENDLENELSEE